MNVDNPAFKSLNFTDLETYLSDDENYPYELIPVNGTKKFHSEDHSFYGYNASPSASIRRDDIQRSVLITTGQYFTLNAPFQFTDGKGFVIAVPDYKSMNMIGGPIEEEGRLKYIDGCTDSLLISPVKKGDCCLNHLHFPIGIRQTMHTHPSDRVGMVVNGKGLCVTPWGNVELRPGMLFIIKRSDGEQSEGNDGKMYDNGSHCFYTTDQPMDVIAWHPDSDYGPEDQNHPMINRTIVDGVAANEIEDIQTQ